MTVWRDRLWIAVLAVVPWLIQPGLTQPDTKVDLTLDPWGYLGRALSAWNPHGGLGEVQNQAYGYLFPMGPFFGVGSSLGLPAWVIQRLWWTLLLVVAFTGMRALIRRWQVAGPTAASIAAVGYALAPRVLTLLSNNSVEAWPYAMAPWLLVVVTRFLAGEWSWRTRLHTVALFALAVAALGGVNAAASAIAVLPALLLLLVHPTGRRRVGLLLLAALLGGLWWILPLLLLGAFAYPFLDYIETASITTAVTSVPNTLRGAQDWVAYILDSASHPVWQGGWVAAQSLTAIVVGCLVAGLGLAGVLRTDGVVRRFALVSVVLGTTVMVVGHPGFAGSPLADPVRSLLNGPLAPLRNVHKFDPLVRIPVALGLARMISLAAHAPGRDLLMRRVRAMGIAVLVLVSFVPLWQGRVGDAAAYRNIPASWRAAATKIDQLTAGVAAGQPDTTLLLPSSRTATYIWGKSTDEPLAALVRSPVVVRASAPLGNPSATRLLDAVDTLTQSGTAQPNLAAGLTRMGIRVVAVRRDLAPTSGAADWRLVEKTLAASPGVHRVPDSTDTHRSLWKIDGALPTTYAHADVVTGGPELLFAGLATGLLNRDTAFLLPDDSLRTPITVLTDAAPWRVYHNGVPPQDAYGPVLTAGDQAPLQAGAKDLPVREPRSARPYRQLIGLRAVSASSSAADPFAAAYRGVRFSQFAAFDGDPTTSWLTGDHEAAGVLTLTTTGRVGGTLSLHFATGAGVTRPARVVVNGHAREVPRGADQLTVPVAAGSSSLRIQLDAPSWVADPVMGLSEAQLSGTDWGSIITVPGTVEPGMSLLLGADPVASTVPARASEGGATLLRSATFGSAVTLRAVATIDTGSTRIDTSCGAAGTVVVADVRVPLRATRAGSGELTATSCGDLRIPAGRATVSLQPATGTALHLLLSPANASAGSSDPAVASVSATTHGYNSGWRSDSAGAAVAVDGWRQGYTGDSAAEHFVATALHRLGLALGAIAVLACALVLLRTRGAREPVELPADPRPSPRARPMGVVLAIVVGALAAGPYGLLLGVVSALCPRRLRGIVVVGALTVAGLALAVGGVVDAKSWGAAVGQVAGTLSLTTLAAGLPDRPATRASDQPSDATPATQ
ncbi:alpha-(1-_3)-arabinofuranosyltransferase domain-containing protein [Calidifontibacter terrae]